MHPPMQKMVVWRSGNTPPPPDSINVTLYRFVCDQRCFHLSDWLCCCFFFIHHSLVNAFIGKCLERERNREFNPRLIVIQAYMYVRITGVCSYFNIYTPSVFCYDKHKKKIDIHFSMKRHEPV